MNVVIQRKGKSEFATGEGNWTWHLEDAALYTPELAGAIIQKKWKNGIKEWKLCGSRYEPIVVGQAIAVDPTKLKRIRR